jgi:polar amino acid transport system substrate-binding protein
MLKKIAITVLCFVCFWLCLLTDGCMRAGPNPNVYIIARDPTWFPINLIGKDNQLSAFTDDLMQAIAAEEGIHIHWDYTLSEDLFTGLENEDYDGILTFKTPSSKNRQNFLFSRGFFFVGAVLLVPMDSKVQSLNQMEGSVIGIEQGTMLSLDIEHYPSITFLPYDNVIRQLDALAGQFIDGAIMPAIPAYNYAKSLYFGRIRVTPSFLTKESLKLAALHTERGETFIQHFNNGLKKLKDNGTYDALLTKWGFHNMDDLAIQPLSH